MKQNKLEFIKVACLVAIAVSLSIIAWKTASQIVVLEEIRDGLNLIAGRVNELKE